MIQKPHKESSQKNACYNQGYASKVGIADRIGSFKTREN